MHTHAHSCMSLIHRPHMLSLSLSSLPLLSSVCASQAPKGSYLFSLSKDGGALSHFKHVLLLASQEDQYVVGVCGDI
jgi:hypothetical protein